MTYAEYIVYIKEKGKKAISIEEFHEKFAQFNQKPFEQICIIILEKEPKLKGLKCRGSINLLLDHLEEALNNSELSEEDFLLMFPTLSRIHDSRESQREQVVRIFGETKKEDIKEKPRSQSNLDFWLR